MSQEPELPSLMRAITAKSIELMKSFKHQPEKTTVLIQQYIDLTQDFQNFLLGLIAHPEQLWQLQLDYWQETYKLNQKQFNNWLTGEVMPIDDRRFNSEEWLNNPFSNFLSQHYLLASEHLNTFLHNLDYGDKRLGKRIQFFTRQYIDALSPANFIYTNPQLLKETLQSRGENLLAGLRNLLADLETGSSQLIIKMTDTKAFKIGVNIATTPGKVIYQNEMMELIQYKAQTAEVKKLPLLIIPPWINKYYILDLSKENSFIDWLVKQGITVFVISWINPDASYAEKGFEDYMQEGPVQALEIIKEQLNLKQINTLGFCIGGTLLACTLAYLKAQKKTPIHSATFLASLIDFSDPGDIGVFIDEEQILRIEKEMQHKGFLDGRLMASTFNSLRANDLIWSFFIKNYLQGKKPLPFDILYWNADATNMPAKMHSQYLRWMYLNNDLIKPGQICLNATPLDLSKIDCPIFFVSTQKDHIAPWQATYLGFQLFKGRKEFLLGGSGHIAGIVNPSQSKKYGFYRNKNNAKTPEEWLAKARYHEGSWWPEWLKWLNKQSGTVIPAPKFKALPYKGLKAAPGEYVYKTYSPNEE